MPHTILVSTGGKIEVGAYSQIGMFSRVTSAVYVKIGKYVGIGPNVFISDYNHEYRNPEKPIIYQGGIIHHKKEGIPLVQIDDNTWLGTNVVIAGTIHIGKNCVVGANSVVTKDVPDNCVVAGIPAKIIKRYNHTTKQWERINQ